MASKVMISVDTETFRESSYPRIVGCKKCGNDAKKIRSFNNPVRDLMWVEKCNARHSESPVGTECRKILRT